MKFLDIEGLALQVNKIKENLIGNKAKKCKESEYMKSTYLNSLNLFKELKL